jgi:hypothetical protein
MTVSWLACAEQFADDACGIGYEAVACTASAWRARCEHDATRNLVRAAAALTGQANLAGLFDPMPPCPSAKHFLRGVEELDGEAAALQKRGQDMNRDCEAALDAAITEYEQARKRLDKARAAGKRDPKAAAAAEAEITAARKRMREMMQVIGDCEAALELLGQVLERLEYALRCFRTVPGDLAEAYDVPLEFIRGGGTLPWSGDFLTPAGAR